MAIRTNPSYTTAHENLGDVYAKLASQAYGKALQLDANNAAVPPKLALIRELFNPATSKGQRPASTLSAPTPVAPPPVAAPAKPAPEPVVSKPAAPSVPAANATPAQTAPVAARPCCPTQSRTSAKCRCTQRRRNCCTELGESMGCPRYERLLVSLRTGLRYTRWCEAVCMGRRASPTHYRKVKNLRDSQQPQYHRQRLEGDCKISPRLQSQRASSVQPESSGVHQNR